MQRLRPLSEQECYLRIYGGRTSDEAVRVVRRVPAPDPVAAAALAERVRVAFESRLDAREPEAA